MKYLRVNTIINNEMNPDSVAVEMRCFDTIVSDLAQNYTLH